MILEVTLKKSPIGRVPAHRKTVRALGLTRVNQTVRHKETPAILGMINQVDYLLEVRRLPEEET
jgi:large subunit ribosomal protein L30|uniref:50S ribosomal protein L30 n=1 Tax=Desulfobacca acetoxidans TaxID=60893 RepID=A0A7C3SJG4_9BACT